MPDDSSRDLAVRNATCCTLLAGLLAPALSAQDDPWAGAKANALESQRAIRFCRRYAEGWLAQADPVSGLLPRTTKGQLYWNAQDCAADNFPFILLTAVVTDNHHLKRSALGILETEQRLTKRLDSLPDDFLFATQSLRRREPRLASLIFGASEYAKDGLLPITEWLGRGPWLARMTELVRDIWKHAPESVPLGRIPSRNLEVNGELLQTMSRLYWLTGEKDYRDWCFRLAEHHLFHQRLLDARVLSLRDHGCEILGGLSEAYVIAAREDKERWQRYRPALHAILDRILEHGVNEDGMMHNGIDPTSGRVVHGGLSDGFGYVYDAFLTVAMIDGVKRYRQAVAHALSRLHGYQCKNVKGLGGADGHADAIEGALNLLNRIPDASAFEWVDREIRYIFELQREDGILEGWYGDGNSARTALMYALWKTQGISPSPWRDDVQLGATRAADGSVRVFLRCDWAWSGKLRFDRPRHREIFRLPIDYPRINQFPEWFTVEREPSYAIQRQGVCPETLSGRELRDYELSLRAGESALIRVRPRPDAGPARRKQRYSSRSAAEALAWQEELRPRLLALLKLEDLGKARPPLASRELSRTEKDGHLLLEVELQSTPGRRIPVLLSIPDTDGKHPAVVCIHGHGGSRRAVHENQRTYRRFAAQLASRGYVTIAADVGQHEVREKGRTLMGERCWDLLRCVDYLESLPNVDPKRIGCAGLSLGGEMAMWLAALDTRIRATVSSGFLTTMDQMEEHHCMCWKLPGLRDLVDWADIYGLIAPRALQCQNGLGEGPRDFYVPLARRAMRQIRPIYADLGAEDRLELDAHEGGHVIHLAALLEFLGRHL
ncbi:MAG: dienelactone hydrolase family protein [Planctomycetota bacterium]